MKNLFKIVILVTIFIVALDILLNFLLIIINPKDLPSINHSDYLWLKLLLGSLFIYVLLQLYNFHFSANSSEKKLIDILKTNGTGQISGICRANNREIDCLQEFFDSNDSDDEILLDFSSNDHNLGSYVFLYEWGELSQQGHSEISYGKLRLLPKDATEFYVNVEIKHSSGLDFEKFYATLIPSPK